ncbi:putative 1,4-beta-D-xylan synthase [Dioscorea sansibarensis]
MKLWALPQGGARRTASFRSSSATVQADGAGGVGTETPLKSPGAMFWIALHALCCLISLILGFRFSRLLFFLLFSSPAPILRATTTTTTTTTTTHTQTQTLTISLPTTPSQPLPIVNKSDPAASRVVVGRHGILIRPWPHPNPTEVMQAHRIIERVQREQRAQYGVKSPKPVIMITPTYVRTFQALHLTGLMHSLMLVPYDLTWIVVEAGGVSNETATLLAKSKLQILHTAFPEKMPVEWSDRHKMEARMRLHGLRIVRERRLDGIVVFADDSNMHSMEMFDEIQSVKWMGAISLGILAHSGNSEIGVKTEEIDVGGEKKNSPLPIQGPACNSSGHLVGWHTFNSLPYAGKSATLVGDGAMVLPRKLEWAGFVLNSRLVWKEMEEKPDWVRDLDTVGDKGEEIESPLALVKDASFVEPLGSCGRKVLLWWLRVEARADSKFPPGWVINPPLEITVPAKRTPWPDVRPEIPSENQADKHPSKVVRSSKSRHNSHSKRKHELRPEKQTSGTTQTQAN